MMNPYTYADSEIARMRTFVNAEFHNAVNELPFDEMNVAKVKKRAKRLFSRLADRNREACERIAKRAYEEAVREAEEARFSPVSVDEKIGSLLALALFRGYHPVTEYVYNNEVIRKRDRFTESVSSARNRNAVRNAYDKATRLWFGQSRQYADLAVDVAREEAFRDAGVRRVRWIAILDKKTCAKCKERDGKIYLLSEVPDKPHRGCRCYTIPVKD